MQIDWRLQYARCTTSDSVRLRKLKHIMKYMDEGVIRELSDDLITKAVNGEDKALQRILEIFDPYITAVSSFDKVLPGGKIVRELDEDMKVQIQMKLVYAIQNKWEK